MARLARNSRVCIQQQNPRGYKTSPFKVNYGQNPRMEFEGKRKKKYETAGKFMEEMKKIQEEAKAVLGKV